MSFHCACLTGEKPCLAPDSEGGRELAGLCHVIRLPDRGIALSSKGLKLNKNGSCVRLKQHHQYVKKRRHFEDVIGATQQGRKRAS